MWQLIESYCFAILAETHHLCVVGTQNLELPQYVVQLIQETTSMALFITFIPLFSLQYFSITQLFSS